MARTDPLAAVTTAKTPQSQPVPGRSDMVKNNAGGYVFAKNDMEQLEDFLILGTTGGTYYLSEDRLTQQNVGVILNLARTRGTDVVRLATEISTAIPPRAPKNRGCLFALAAVSALGDPAGVQAVKVALPQVARTTDHLAMFFGYRKQLKSKSTARGTAPIASRAYRSALASWFTAADADAVAFRACKARQRKTPAGESMELLDILRIAHPRSDTLERKVLFGWLAGNVSDEQAARHLPAVDRFLQAQAADTEAKALRAVTELRVPWEFLPSSVLKSPKVWEALTETIGMTALLRNLARMTRLGTLGPFQPANAVVTRRLTSAEGIAKARIHPMDAYLAMHVYAAGKITRDVGRGRSDTETWSPVAGVLDALEETYELAFGNITPSGRKLLIAVDSSGSMSSGWGWGGGVTFGGASLGSPYAVACGVAAIMKRIEGESAHVIDIDTRVHPSKITKRTNIREIRNWRPSGGGTDLSLGFSHASQHGLRVDGFLVLTDNETWAGGWHPFQALEAYRSQYNAHARVLVAALAANGRTINDQCDPGVMNMAGMDASLPQVVTGFIRGDG